MITFEFEAIGTHWQIDIGKEISSEEESFLLERIKNRIDKFDKDYSRFRDDSLVMKMSRESGDFTLPEDADKMISIYKKMYDLTEGLVTPLIGQVLSDAGYDAKYSMKEKSLTKPLPWEDVLSWNNPTLNLKQPTLLDFGAGGKGYLVDIVSELLEKEGIDSYCVDAGGDMRCRGKELRVGLEHPEDPKKVIGVVKIKNQSLCGSAGNRRAWRDFHHIIDPEKLSSPKDIISVWTVSRDTLTADILTTGLVFASPQKLKEEFDFEYLILRSDYSIEKSDGLEVELFG